jgi:hypothetical protein
MDFLNLKQQNLTDLEYEKLDKIDCNLIKL